MEVFSRMMNQAERGGFIEGFYAVNSNTALTVSHLFFADDSIIFCGADLLQLGHLRCILLGFEAVTGLNINLSKSEILPVGCSSGFEDLAAVLGCKTGSLPTIYLGMPLGSKVKSKVFWGPVIDRCRKRLAEWQTSYLSVGARLTLIKSVLSNLPTYYLSLFPAPSSVIQVLEKIQRNFLWGRSEEIFKFNLVDWKVVCKPSLSGGAGIRNLKLQNEALMGKWLWRFAQENFSLWKRVIVIKYGEEKGGWLSAEGSRNFGISLWKYIRRTWADFGNLTSWKVGRGDRIMFWKHKWLEIGCLSAVFPEIFTAAADKEALISDYYKREGSTLSWNIQLRRNLND